MKSHRYLLALLALSLPLVAEEPKTPLAQPTTAGFLKGGSPVKIESLVAAKWLQGAAPTEWTQDEIYIFESWATWCGPCIAAIPHMEELHRKYGQKGVHIHGMNVMDKDEPTAAAFLKKKGEGMTYPVAWVEKETGAFEREWLKPARVTGIPHTFVIMNGKILFTTHPMSLTDEVVDALLAGGDARDKVVAKFTVQNVKTDTVETLRAEMRQALESKDIALAKAKLAEFEKVDPSGGRDLVPQVAKVEIAVLSGEGFPEALDGVKAPWIMAMMVTNQEEPGKEWSQEQMKAAISRLGKFPADQPDLQGQLALATLLWKTGDQAASKAIIQQGIDMPGSVVTGPLKRLMAKMEKNEYPPMTVTLGDIRASSGQGH